MSDIKTPWNPSRKATARVKNPLPVPVVCNFCHGFVRVGTHKEIYGRDFSDWPWVYLCESCGAYVGLHPFTSIPLGTLADKATRQARKECKPYFEKLWRNGEMSRTRAYEWLAKQLNIPVNACHFGWFDIDKCQRARELCQRHLLAQGIKHE